MRTDRCCVRPHRPNPCRARAHGFASHARARTRLAGRMAGVVELERLAGVRIDAHRAFGGHVDELRRIDGPFHAVATRSESAPTRRREASRRAPDNAAIGPPAAPLAIAAIASRCAAVARSSATTPTDQFPLLIASGVRPSTMKPRPSSAHGAVAPRSISNAIANVQEPLGRPHCQLARQARTDEIAAACFVVLPSQVPCRGRHARPPSVCRRVQAPARGAAVRTSVMMPRSPSFVTPRDALPQPPGKSLDSYRCVAPPWRATPTRRSVDRSPPFARQRVAGSAGLTRVSASASPKVTRPRLAGIVARERLFAQISHSATPILWISAPPGAGKTTLAASYMEATKRTALWYQVDSADADPATLFFYMREAAAQGGLAKALALPLLPPESVADLASFARRYFRDLFAKLPRAALVTFDNFQDADGPAFETMTREAFAQVPDGVTVLVLSLSDPPPALARLVANRSIGIIGADELRFTRSESDQVASSRLSIDEDALATLHERSAGWAAGLVLMTEHMRRAGPFDEASLAESQEAVFDYFAGEILSRAAPADQRALMLTASLPRVTACIDGSDERPPRRKSVARAALRAAPLHRSAPWSGAGVSIPPPFSRFPERTRTRASRNCRARRIGGTRGIAARDRRPYRRCGHDASRRVRLECREPPDRAARAQLVPAGPVANVARLDCRAAARRPACGPLAGVLGRRLPGVGRSADRATHARAGVRALFHAERPRWPDPGRRRNDARLHSRCRLERARPLDRIAGSAPATREPLRCRRRYC